MSKKSNALIIHGGGLVDPSKHVLMRIGKNLSNSKVYDKNFIGNYSFESIYTPEFIREYNDELVTEVREKRGTWFGTCRGIDLCNQDLFKKAVTCLNEKNIKTIIVVGGDGSSRQVAEIADNFAKKGINIIFPIPLTIDGINGGLSIGINEAVSESIRQIENIASTSLQTRDNEAFGVVMVELQGGNRDDIIAKVLQRIYLSGKVADYNIPELLLRVIPANFETNEYKLINEINQSNKRTLVLISEGSKINISELTKKIKRRVRSLTVGYSSQSNNMTNEEDIVFYNKWIDEACSIIERKPYDSYCLANLHGNILIEPIDYYAVLNPRNGQKANLPKDLNVLLGKYMSN